jgi:hypothetical protein
METPRTLYIQNQGGYQQMTQCTKSHQSNWLDPSMDVRPHQHGKFHSSIHIWPGHPKKDKLLATSFAEGLFHSQVQLSHPNPQNKKWIKLASIEKKMV